MTKTSPKTTAGSPRTTQPERGDPSPPRRSRARKGEGPRLRDEILEATEKLLLKTGSAEAVSIRAVAEAVGVTPPSIYRHFPDKTTLIFEVCARYFAALDDAIDAAVTGIDDPVLQLKARASAYVHFGRDNPEPYRIMFMLRPEESPTNQPDDWVLHSQTYGALMANVQACIDADRFQPGYDDAYRICLGFWARVHGLVSLMISKPFLPWSHDDFIDQYLHSCVHGIVA